MNMLKQKRMLKLYIGILVFGVVFSFRNVNWFFAEYC